jgi:hypothetical protein
LLAGLAWRQRLTRRFRQHRCSPVCSYGYYDYAPYACAPYGFYGPGYFYNGIFLGMGPWAGWGYGHGWGGHRFVEVMAAEAITAAAAANRSSYGQSIAAPAYARGGGGQGSDVGRFFAGSPAARLAGLGWARFR